MLLVRGEEAGRAVLLVSKSEEIDRLLAQRFRTPDNIQSGLLQVLAYFSIAVRKAAIG